LLCREFSIVKDHDHGIYAAPLCCRSWTCDYCRPERKARVKYQAQLGKPDTFITLTTNPARGSSAAARAAELVVAWRQFVKHAKKLYGYASIPYFAVFEATKLGQPHLHILCRVKWIDQRILSAFMRDRINAPIVDIRRTLAADSAARYITKYLGKAPAKFGTCKRYWQTRDYKGILTDPEPPPEYAGRGWRIEKVPIQQVLLNYGARHHLVEKVGPVWKITARGPP